MFYRKIKFYYLYVYNFLFLINSPVFLSSLHSNVEYFSKNADEWVSKIEPTVYYLLLLKFKRENN